MDKIVTLKIQRLGRNTGTDDFLPIETVQAKVIKSYGEFVLLDFGKFKSCAFTDDIKKHRIVCV